MFAARRLPPPEGSPRQLGAQAAARGRIDLCLWHLTASVAPRHWYGHTKLGILMTAPCHFDENSPRAGAASAQVDEAVAIGAIAPLGLAGRFGAGGSWPDWRCCCSATPRSFSKLSTAPRGWLPPEILRSLECNSRLPPPPAPLPSPHPTPAAAPHPPRRGKRRVPRWNLEVALAAPKAFN